ncbi:MAG TPA: ATP phosphoribosyltransferase [Chloroflexi bacterium]|nr:ATP phosphoribosyltransferase [Chloroflexota bacterium]
MNQDRRDIRLALPSKGRLADDALELLASSGLRVHKPNPRQYAAIIPSLPGITVLFQRPGDIVVSIRDGSVDFGITGWDVVSEGALAANDGNGSVLTLLKNLGFGECTLNVIVPENWSSVKRMVDLGQIQAKIEHPSLRIATKFHQLTKDFFIKHGYEDIRLISAEGTLEIAPSIGYADLIVDLVSTGTTLRDNRLRTLQDGLILESQACLIANKITLRKRPEVLAIAKRLLEFIVANLRAEENVAIFANVRSDSPEAIAASIFKKKVIGGLQGPTISPVIAREGGDWFAVNIIVRKDQLAEAIEELRDIGGSGVIVSPVNFIFEEEPPAYRDMLAALEG